MAITGVVDVIIEFMTGNASYVDPDPTLADVTLKNNAAKAAITKAAGGGKLLTALKNVAMADLGTIVRALAPWVMVKANGDLSVLISSGFPIQKPTRGPVAPVATPATPTVLAGDIAW